MATHSPESADDPDDEGTDPAVAYERVLETIRQQTGDPDDGLRPSASDRHLRTVCCSHGSLKPDEYRRALRRAIENDDVFCYQTEEGYHFVRREEAALRHLIKAWERARFRESADQMLLGLIEAVADADDLPNSLVGRANEARRVLSSGGDGDE